MKTFHLPPSILAARNLAAMLTLLAVGVSAQEPPAVRATPASESVSSGYDESVFDLLAADGVLVRDGKKVEASLGNVVDVLRARYPDANLVLSPGLAKLKIADLKLRGGRLCDELEAIRVASGAKFEWLAPDSAGPNQPPASGQFQVDPITGLPLPRPTGDNLNRGLFVLRAPPPRPEEQRIIEAFNLGGYLDWLWSQQEKQSEKSREAIAKQGMDELLRILEGTIQWYSQSAQPAAKSLDSPGFQFHPGANLLIVIGTVDSVEIVRRVVSALPGQPDVELRQHASRGFGRSGQSGAEIEDTFRRRYGLPAPPVAPPAPAPPSAQSPPRF
ncbi:MAG: hypothetical protein KIS67_19245 [Verrucomicrobiae bacterium]|nr:hypothetical protein [Verrucomicrobiae bacterium]